MKRLLQDRAALFYVWWLLTSGIAVGAEISRDDGFRLAAPGYVWSFPRDHAAHPDFRTEWWYFTGYLHDEQKKETFGYEWTFFRTAIQSRARTKGSAWGLRDLFFAHFAISDLDRKIFWQTEKISRGALGLAGVDRDKLKIWIEDWSLRSEKGFWHLEARSEKYSLDLYLKSLKPEVIHGMNGVSRKADETGHATHYVSLTKMETFGTLKRSGLESLRVKGESWHDHEFGSHQLSNKQVGWDWFSLRLDSGEELMIYLIRKKDGCFDLNSSGTWVDRNGKASHLKIDELSVLSTGTWKSPRTGIVYPAQWEIRVPKFGLNVSVNPMLATQEFLAYGTAGLAYWEGACHVSGSHNGRGYVELTGYGK